MIGNALDACTSATMSCELAIAVIIQAAPTAWINPPKFDAMLAIQIIRNVGSRNGASVEIRSGKSLPPIMALSPKGYRPEDHKFHPRHVLKCLMMEICRHQPHHGPERMRRVLRRSCNRR